jgi:type I restriction enzyme S subunit
MEFNNQWKEDSLKNLIEIGRGFAFKSSEYVEYGHKIVRVTNIAAKGAISLGSNCVFVSEDDFKKYRKYALFNNDVLLVMVGATAGKLGFVTDKTLPALLNQNMWVLRTLDENYLNQKFFRFIIQPAVNSFLHTQQGSASGFFTP